MQVNREGITTKRYLILMDALVELPAERWAELKDLMKRLWPLYLPGYCALEHYEQNLEMREEFQFKVYCPFGKIEYGFVATNLKIMPDCIIFPNSSASIIMEAALVETKLINWSHQQKLCVDLVTSQTLQCLENVRNRVGFRHFQINHVKAFYFPANAKPFLGLSGPAHVNVNPVKAEHINQVNDSWAYKDLGSHQYFSILAKYGLSYGLYIDDQLVGWVFINNYRFLCHLNIKEEYRRKGYAEYLIKLVVNDQIGKGNDVYTYVENYNKKSLALFMKIGFIMFDEAAYAIVQK